MVFGLQTQIRQRKRKSIRREQLQSEKEPVTDAKSIEQMIDDIHERLENEEEGERDPQQIATITIREDNGEIVTEIH